MNEKDKYVVAKKLDKISEPFIMDNGITAMDNGYYILEMVPKNKKYFVEETIWDLFNWTCWWHDKFDTYLKGIRKGFRKQGYRCFPNSNARGYCNSDIFFKLEDKWMISKPVGWDVADSYEEAVKKVIQ